jgi:malate dehydrogenase
MQPRVSVIGSGAVVAAAQSKLEANGAFQVVVCDPRAETTANGSRTNPADTANSQVLVLPASELLNPSQGLEEFSRCLSWVMPYSSDPVIVVADHTTSELCEIARAVSGVSPRRVIGIGTLPDSWRLRRLIAAELGIPAETVEALAVGAPGPRTVPLVRIATASGVPIPDLLAADQLAAILDAFRAPQEVQPWLSAERTWLDDQAAAIERIVTAVALGRADLFPCTVSLSGEYGLSEVFVGVPAVIGAEGVQRIVELDLNMDELISLRLMSGAGERSSPASCDSSLGTAAG